MYNRHHSRRLSGMWKPTWRRGSPPPHGLKTGGYRLAFILCRDGTPPCTTTETTESRERRDSDPRPSSVVSVISVVGYLTDILQHWL